MRERPEWFILAMLALLITLAVILRASRAQRKRRREPASPLLLARCQPRWEQHCPRRGHHTLPTCTGRDRKTVYAPRATPITVRGRTQAGRRTWATVASTSTSAPHSIQPNEAIRHPARLQSFAVGPEVENHTTRPMSDVHLSGQCRRPITRPPAAIPAVMGRLGTLKAGVA